MWDLGTKDGLTYIVRLFFPPNSMHQLQILQPCMMQSPSLRSSRNLRPLMSSIEAASWPCWHSCGSTLMVLAWTGQQHLALQPLLLEKAMDLCSPCMHGHGNSLVTKMSFQLVCMADTSRLSLKMKT